MCEVLKLAVQALPYAMAEAGPLFGLFVRKPWNCTGGVLGVSCLNRNTVNTVLV